MKSLHKIFITTILATLLFSVPSFANRTVDNKMEDIREATSEIQTLSGEDCDENAKEIIKQLKATKKAIEELEAEVSKLNTKVANASPSKKADARTAATAAQDSLTAAIALLEDAMSNLKGIKAADALIEELGLQDVTGNTRKRELRDELIEEIRNAGNKNPCDSISVVQLAKDKLTEQENSNKVKNNGEIRPWHEKLKKLLEEEDLISMNAGSNQYLFIGLDQNETTEPPLFAVEIYGSQHFAPTDEVERHLNRFFETMQNHIYSDPSTFQNLVESLGGEFVIGGLSGEATPAFEAPKTTRSIGLGGQVNFSSSWMAEASFSKANGEASAQFPVTIFEGFTGQPKTVVGLLQLQMEWLRYALGGGYRSGSGTFRPFATGGVQFLKTKTSNAQGHIDDILLPPGLHTDTSQFSIGAYGRAGMEIHTNTGLYFSTSMTGAFEKGQEGAMHFVPGIRVGAGWQF